jgi:hypothetical protein
MGIRRTRCRGVARDVVGLGRRGTTGRIPPSYCSGYPWDVKTGQDPEASQVNLESVTPTTVGHLTSLPAQPNLPDDHRLPPTEPSRTAATPASPPRETIRIRADVRNALKKEADQCVLGESYRAEVLIEQGLKELPPAELG